MHFAYLNSSKKMKDILSLGPWGNENSQNWKIPFLQREILMGLRIRHGFVVYGITFITRGPGSNKITIESPVGGHYGKCDEVEFNIASGEYITQISGTFADYSYGNDVCCITSMTIYTNLNQNGYGPYGVGREEGKYGATNVSSFSTPWLYSNAIVGFYGRANICLESIGLLINPAPFKIGPWGHPHDWCFMFENQILKGIKICHDSVIHAIAFKVADHNSMTWENTYGGPGGHIDEILLSPHINEYVTQISGTIANYSKDKDIRCISSLTFYTNLRPDGYGPYGLGRKDGEHEVANVSSFSTPLLSNNAIIGFHGSVDRYLESIGIIISPVGRLT